MTSTVVTATTSVEAAESSTASTTETVVAATASTAEVIAVPPSVVSGAFILPLEPATTEIVTISLQIRRALECPIVLHADAVEHQHYLCSLFRTSMVQSSYMSAMVIKLPEATPLVKVACSNWSFRCPDLVPVRPVNEHESVCRSGRMEISWFRRYNSNSQVRNHPSST
ncbi:unnamed protein product [Macrosiphum euphorbiae]|uniref:Uncharacterized protein n=1 Tax=Macrosiphum euphorbiae TaxID=13131 RepID=A0AAV0WEM5_9HEMI|nr:unnamed protein product [Macrosiphum euphorbiae]